MRSLIIAALILIISFSSVGARVGGSSYGLRATGEGSINGLSWNGTHWLIVGYWSNQSSLAIYDGERFYGLQNPGEFYFGQVLWNNKSNFWIITGHTNDSAFLLKYEEDNLDVLTSVHSYCTGYLAWTGNHYLLVRCGSAMVGATEYAKISERGSELKESEDHLLNFGGYGRLFNVNGKVYAHNGSVLFQYNGTSFKRFHKYSKSIREIGSNRSTWLVCGEEVAKYNGSQFQIAAKKRCTSVSYGKRYWLIESESFLFKYSGGGIKRVTKSPEFEDIRDISWNGDYWLIGGRDPEGSPLLVKYDGESFEDLTPKLFNAKPVGGKAGKLNQSSNEPAKAQAAEEKPICGPTAILLAVLLVTILVLAVLGSKRLR